MGIKDIGFGMTVSDRNADDLIELYRLASAMNLEFATATTHNSFYFHTTENQYENREKVAQSFENIAVALLKTNRPKNWFRAYFNMGLARKARGQKRALPCEVGTDMFFVEPNGNVVPCNGSDQPMVMGNLHEHNFDEIWHSQRAEEVRQMVRRCDKQCWMIGSASPAMKKRIRVPLKWVIRNKVRLLLKKNDHKDICLEPIDK
jgi:MoaA/NifB/PqqE/SkfB family radical SAM enzyme